MFKCSQCKIHYEGEPAKITGNKSQIRFCAECSHKHVTAMHEALRKHHEAIAARNQCLWCDEKLTEHNRATNKHSGNVNMCRECDSHSDFRKQLEKCLVAGDPSQPSRIMRYLTKPDRVERWQQERVAKAAAKAAKAKATEVKVTAPAENSLPLVNQAEWELFQKFKKLMEESKH
jgi:hypothetical protein